MNVETFKASRKSTARRKNSSCRKFPQLWQNYILEWNFQTSILAANEKNRMRNWASVDMYVPVSRPSQAMFSYDSSAPVGRLANYSDSLKLLQKLLPKVQPNTIFVIGFLRCDHIEYLIDRLRNIKEPSGYWMFCMWYAWISWQKGDWTPSIRY